jgi:hypothetical protein
MEIDPSDRLVIEPRYERSLTLFRNGRRPRSATDCCGIGAGLGQLRLSDVLQPAATTHHFVCRL